MITLDFDVIVIGSGPSGITAAIYLKRANINVVLIDGNAPGGQMNRIAMVENYPGFTKITGPDLAYNMFAQTQALGIPYKYGKVLNIVDMEDYKIVKTDKEELTCKSIIIASGRKPKELGLPNEKNLVGRGISWCAICDGILFKNKEIAVVGGGNSALEESLYLADIASKVSIIYHGSQFKVNKNIQTKIANNPKINVHFDSEVTKLNVSNNMLDSIEIMNTDSSNIETINAKCLFIYIGFEPAIKYLEDLDIKNDNGYVTVDDMMHTNVDGIYACGDIIKKDLYQITTAIADGSKAAMSVIKDLKED